MAQIKISELELNTQMSNEDVLAGVDTSEQKTKKFKLETLKNFINKEQDEQITKNKNDISANATNIETNAENISKNSENIEKNTQDIIENKENITDNSLRIKRITNDLYDSGEASGSSINIKDSTLAEFQEISVDGVCKQVTTTGKNHIDKDNYILDTWDKNYDSFRVDIKAGTYTLSSNTTMMAIKSSDHISSSWEGLPFGTGSKTKKYTFTINQDYTGGIVIKLDGELPVNHTNIANYDIQLEEGSEVTNYEPYTGLQASPNPSYPQEIEVIDEGFEVKSCGKNVLNYTNVISGQGLTNTLNEDGSITSKGTLTEDYANLTQTQGNNRLPKGKYTFSISNPMNLRVMIRFRRPDGTTLAYEIPAGKTSYTFELNEEHVHYYLFYFKQGSTGQEVDITLKYQLEIGDKATPFEPYQETVAPINLKGEFVGKDDKIILAFKEENGEYQSKLHKEFNIETLNGTEDWEYNEQYNYFRCPSYVFAKTPVGTTSERMCSHFNVMTNWEEFRNGTNTDGIFITKDGYKICIRNTKCSTVEELKQWLSENNVQIGYKLAEPYEIDLGVVDMPLSFSPETNVFTTSDLQPNINAKYYRNFINTIQNLQVNEKALQQELIDINSRLSALETNLVNLANVESESEE